MEFVPYDWPHGMRCSAVMQAQEALLGVRNAKDEKRDGTHRHKKRTPECIVPGFFFKSQILTWGPQPWGLRPWGPQPWGCSSNRRPPHTQPADSTMTSSQPPFLLLVCSPLTPVSGNPYAPKLKTKCDKDDATVYLHPFRVKNDSAILIMTSAIGIQIGIGTEIDEEARNSTPIAIAISISTVRMNS